MVVPIASIGEREGATMLLAKAKTLPNCAALVKIWADGGYIGENFQKLVAEHSWTIEIIKRSDVQKGFVVLPKRWMVERTFGWLGHFRCLAKDYKRKPATAEAFIFVAMNRLLLKRFDDSNS